ncbi:hypothetical protein H5410_021512, partial [Solanum commersonii]
MSHMHDSLDPISFILQAQELQHLQPDYPIFPKQIASLIEVSETEQSLYPTMISFLFPGMGMVCRISKLFIQLQLFLLLNGQEQVQQRVSSECESNTKKKKKKGATEIKRLHQ